MLFGVMSINLGELSHKMHIKLQKIWLKMLLRTWSGGGVE